MRVVEENMDLCSLVESRTQEYLAFAMAGSFKVVGRKVSLR